MSGDMSSFPNREITISPNSAISAIVVEIIKHYPWERATLVLSSDVEWYLNSAAIEVKTFSLVVDLE